jgi:homoserine acetyltransferase
MLHLRGQGALFSRERKFERQHIGVFGTTERSRVDAQYRLLTEGLGVRHVRLIIGNSMGGMHAWLWSEKYPDYMDALVPMASQPTAMASRNWMLRRMMLELIRNDPEYKDGNYTTQPQYLRLAGVFFGIATAGGTLNYQKLAPTREKADKLVEARLAAPMNADANDFIWAWASSADYDAAPDEVEMREITVQRTFANFDEFWTISTSSSVQPIIAAMAANDVELLKVPPHAQMR